MPYWFIEFLRIARRTGRMDLIEPIVGNIIKNADRQHFHADGMTIRHLTFIIDCTQMYSEKEILSLLDRCITPRWIISQYLSEQVSIGSLAAALASIAFNDSKAIRSYFRREALLIRLWREAPSDSTDAETLGVWLQLLGAASLLGRLRNAPHMSIIGSRRLSMILQFYAPRPEVNAIEHVQAQLWVGLREWCRLTSEQLAVEGYLAEVILDKYRNAVPKRPRIKITNDIMIQWLELSRSNEWVLITPKRSLRKLIDRNELVDRK